MKACFVTLTQSQQTSMKEALVVSMRGLKRGLSTEITAVAKMGGAVVM